MADRIDHDEITRRFRKQINDQIKGFSAPILASPMLMPITIPANLGWRGIQTLIGGGNTSNFTGGPIPKIDKPEAKREVIQLNTAKSGDFTYTLNDLPEELRITNLIDRTESNSADDVKKEQVNKIIPQLPSRNFKNKKRGGSRWVGVNSEWRDRYDNVIAPRENFNSSVDRKGEPIEVKKQPKKDEVIPNIKKPEVDTHKVSVGDGKTFNPQAGGFVGDVGKLKYNSAFQMPTKDNITFNKDAPRIAPMQSSASNKLKFGFGSKEAAANTFNVGSEIFGALAKFQASKKKTPRSQSSPAPIPQLAMVQNPEGFYSLLG
tara:strand:- start:436 stop:1392 length:957 start_codon:yes stop_codon:yes gene_type:complete